MRAYREALGAERGDGLVEDLAAAAHERDVRAVARELRGDLEADAGAPARDQRGLAPRQVRAERRLHCLPLPPRSRSGDLGPWSLVVGGTGAAQLGKKMAVGTVVDRLRGLVFDTRKESPQVEQIVFEENVE